MTRKSQWRFLVPVALTSLGCAGEILEVEEPAESTTAELFLSQASLRAGPHLNRLPNNFPIFNSGGFGATFSTDGFLDFNNEFHTPQGTNGRDCSSCHLPTAGYGMTPAQARLLFDLTGGTHPLFNPADANTPTSDVSTVAARRQSYSMLLQGKFVRSRTPPANREFDVIAASDPFGVGTTARLLFFRRPPPTANFKSHTVMWDGANSFPGDLHSGLAKQAKSNIMVAQQGATPTDETVNAIVAQELGLSNAQLWAPGVGRLDADGARGGPEHHASQPLVAGRFDLYDAWIGHRNARKAQIARGQELFNNVNPASGGSCQGCHNAANSGQNVNGVLFDVGASDGAHRKPDMAVYTVQNRTTGQTRTTTDPGAGFITGKWSDMNRFKTPTLRGLASRAPYFHNGIADTLADVVRHYEVAMGFDFTPSEEADLVAFMNAL